jgi:type II secretory pathway component PulJ
MFRCTEHLRNRRNRSAFTLVETCIGLVIIAMVLSAAAAFALSTADAWNAGATTDPVSGQQITATVHVIATLAAVRLENELSSADSPGGYYAGSLTDPTVQQAELMLWTDANSNHVMESSELELIQYDATNHMLVKYLPTGTTTAPTGYTQLSDPTWIATYRATATEVPLARFVDGVQFNVQNPNSTVQKPLVEYQLRFVRNDQVTMRYGAVCMRAPSTPNGP